MDSEKIFELKNRYGNIYSVKIKNYDLIFRELTFKEYDEIIYLKDLDDYSSADIEDLILKFAIVYPEDFDINRIPPGNVSSLAQNVLDQSALTSVDLAKSIIEEKRDEINQVKNLMKAFVLATITTYSPEELDLMTFSQLAHNVALSEKIIEIRQAMNGIQPSNISLQLIDPNSQTQNQSPGPNNKSRKPAVDENLTHDPIAQKLWGAV